VQVSVPSSTLVTTHSLCNAYTLACVGIWYHTRGPWRAWVDNVCWTFKLSVCCTSTRTELIQSMSATS